MLNGYQFFQIQHSLKLHFTSKFDILKYGSKSACVSPDIFHKRQDKSRFDNFAGKLHNSRIAMNFCIANFVHSNEGWLYESYSYAATIYTEWRGYFDAFKYKFKVEYDTLTGVIHEKNIKFKDTLVPTKRGNAPPLLQLMVHSEVTPEFICTLNSTFNFLDAWSGYVANDPFLEQQVFILKKYSPLCNIIRKGRQNY